VTASIQKSIDEKNTAMWLEICLRMEMVHPRSFPLKMVVGSDELLSELGARPIFRGEMLNFQGVQENICSATATLRLFVFGTLFEPL